MKVDKVCPQCSTDFMGRSNQLYCSDRCKVEAFRAGKMHSPDKVVTTSKDQQPSVTVTNQASEVARFPARVTTDKFSKVDLQIRRLELEHERQVKQMEMEEAARRRVHEQTMARLEVDDENRNNELQRLAKQVDELSRKAVPPLDEWMHFPVGVRRRYQALVRAAFKAAEVPMYRSVCDGWLDEYRPYYHEVHDWVTHKKLPPPVRKPFTWLADLAQLIEKHGRVILWSDDEQDLVLILPSELRQQLTQACL